MSSRYRAVIAIGILFAAIGGFTPAAEEVLFERPVSEDDKTHFDFTTFRKNDVSKFESLELARKVYKRLPRGPEDVKVVLVYDDAKKPQYVEITIRSPKKVATIYEAEAPKGDVEKYESSSETEELPENMSTDDIRATYGKEYWDRRWGIQKVELYFNGTWKGQYDKEPRLSITRLRADHEKKTVAMEQEQQEWKAEAKAKLSAGTDAGDFKQTAIDYRFPDVMEMQLRPWVLKPLGILTETMENKNGSRIGAEIVQWPRNSIPDHEILRPVMLFDPVQHGIKTKGFGLQKTVFGPSLVCDCETESLEGKSIKVHMFHWKSGNLQVSVQATGASIDEVFALYGKRLPSSLSDKLDIDKTIWYRDEASYFISRMKDAIPFPIYHPENTFLISLGSLSKIASLPGVDVPQVPIESEKKQELFGKVEAWWNTSKDSLVWSNDTKRLILKQDTKAPPTPDKKTEDGK